MTDAALRVITRAVKRRYDAGEDIVVIPSMVYCM